MLSYNATNTPSVHSEPTIVFFIFLKQFGFFFISISSSHSMLRWLLRLKDEKLMKLKRFFNVFPFLKSFWDVRTKKTGMFREFQKVTFCQNHTKNRTFSPKTLQKHSSSWSNKDGKINAKLKAQNVRAKFQRNAQEFSDFFSWKTHKKCRINKGCLSCSGNAPYAWI